MPRMNASDWINILTSLELRNCVPFLGAGAAASSLPTGRQIAIELASQFEYPFTDSEDLIRVSEHTKVENGPQVPKGMILNKIRGARLPRDAANSEEFHTKNPHVLLAQLPIKYYVTTNYDTLMCQALEAVGKKPAWDLCRWNHSTQVFGKSRPKFSLPDESAPLVYHLHGHVDHWQSLVLTEDDYLDFLTSLAADADLIPPRICEQLASACIIFLGYRLADWSFQVVFRSIGRYLQNSSQPQHISVQLNPPGTRIPAEMYLARAKSYLEKRFREQKVAIYWSSCEDFLEELLRRWLDYQQNPTSYIQELRQEFREDSPGSFAATAGGN